MVTPNAPSRSPIWPLILAMILPFIAALIYFVLLKTTQTAQIVYIATKLFTLTWPIITIKLIFKKPILPTNFTWAYHVRALPLSLAVSLLMAAVILIAYKTPPLHQIIQQARPQILAKVQSLSIQQHFLIFGILLSTVHSLIEEYYWRWFVFNQLTTHTTTIRAAFFASFAFAAHHYIILGALFPLWLTALLGTTIAIAGLIWCWLLQKQKSIVAPWLPHIAADLAIIYIAYHLIQ